MGFLSRPSALCSLQGLAISYPGNWWSLCSVQGHFGYQDEDACQDYQGGLVDVISFHKLFNFWKLPCYAMTRKVILFCFVILCKIQYIFGDIHYSYFDTLFVLVSGYPPIFSTHAWLNEEWITGQKKHQLSGKLYTKSESTSKTQDWILSIWQLNYCIQTQL